MRFFTFLLLFFSSLPSYSELIIENTWVKNAPSVSPVRAAYFNVTNTSSDTIIINRVSSPNFNRVEIHETRYENGLYSMHELGQLTIASQSTVELKPRGKHLMLMMPTQSLSDLTHIDLNIHYGSKTISQKFPIKDAL